MSIIPIDALGVDENLSYYDNTVYVLNLQVNKFIKKELASVKVLWRNNLVEYAKWEAEADMKSHYPHLFKPWGYTVFLLKKLMNKYEIELFYI